MFRVRQLVSVTRLYVVALLGSCIIAVWTQNSREWDEFAFGLVAVIIVVGGAFVLIVGTQLWAEQLSDREFYEAKREYKRALLEFRAANPPPPEPPEPPEVERFDPYAPCPCGGPLSFRECHGKGLKRT